MKILVTGAAGFVGRHLVAAAASHGQVIAVVRSSVDIAGAFVVEPVNLSDRDAVRLLFERWRPDVVLHAAARVAQSSSDDIYTFFDDNVRATINIYHYSQVSGTRQVVFSSSFSVYGRPKALPVSEDHLVDPSTPYALSKIQGEYVGRLYAESGLQTTVLRYSGIFGTGQHFGAVPTFIARCLRNDPVVLNAGGRPSSDFVWVEDVVQANLRALQYDQPRSFEVLNIGSGVELTVAQLASMIRDLCGSRSTIQLSDDQSPRDFRFSYDISRAQEQLGYAPTPIPTALETCINPKLHPQP